MGIMLQGWLKQNPEFAGRDFYITGESYAGHYVPAIAHYLLSSGIDLDLNLKAIGIGNGLTDPYEQYPAYASFSYENNLIDKAGDEFLEFSMKICQGLIYGANHYTELLEVPAMELCQLAADSVITPKGGLPTHPKFNVYDIREPCDDPPLCYDFSQADTFLNSKDVTDTIGVTGRKWESCDMLVHTFLLGDWMNNLMPDVVDILDNYDVQVLVYSGDKDWICNWRGGEAWTLATKWASQEDFNKQPYTDWTVNGQPAGAMRQFGDLHFLRVYDAGHMVPMDQPEHASAMLDMLLNNDWSLGNPGTESVDLFQ